MVTAEEMHAWPNFANRVHGLAVFRQVDSAEQDFDHIGLVDVHDKFFISHRESAFHPAGSMEDEIHAREGGRQHGINRLRSGLRVR